jgi:hypothetical protein
MIHLLDKNVIKMKNTPQNTVIYVAGIIVVLLISSFTLKQVIQAKEAKPTTSGFVILELFTSQGCSSCPPADTMLAKYALQKNPNIIPLTFHVDYWNLLGWKDPFSKAQFSERQQDYSNMMNTQGNYTPQLIINGKYELVGSKESEIKDIVAAELAIKKQNTISIIKATLNNSQVKVKYDFDGVAPNSVINLALLKKEGFTSIKRGENTGLKQTCYNIVFDFKTVSNTSNAESFEFKKEWLSSDYFVVVYLQNSKTGKVLAASKSEIK